MANVSVVLETGRSPFVATKLVVAVISADSIGVGQAKNNDMVLANSKGMANCPSL